MSAVSVRRLFLGCLTVGLVLAGCEPITVVLPGGTVVLNPIPGLTPNPEDGGTEDAGTVDAGTEDGGTDAGSLDWSPCLDGWQRRVAVPLANRSGDAYFALRASGDAYVVQYPNRQLGVRSVESGPLPSPDLGWDTIPWVGALEVDARDTLHLGTSSENGGALGLQSIQYLTYAEGAWTKTPVGNGRILDFALAPDGSAHMLFLDGKTSYRFVYASNCSGAFVSEPTGISAGDQPVLARMRLDPQGLPQFVYDGRLSGMWGIHFVRREGGTWVHEQVSPTGMTPALALDGDGVPHVVWTWTDGLWHGVRVNGTWSTAHVASDVSGLVDAQVDAQGKLHVLATDTQGTSILYLSDASGGWERVTLASVVEANGEHLGPVMRLRLDAAGRVHAMYSLLYPNAAMDRIDRVVEYSRQCP